MVNNSCKISRRDLGHRDHPRGGIPSSAPRASDDRRSCGPREQNDLKILFVVESCSAGVGRHALDLAERFAGGGCEVHLIFSPQRADRTFLERLDRLPAIRRASCPMCRGIHPSDLRAVWFIRGYLLKHGPFDVIHGHSSKGGALSRLSAPGSGARVFYTSHALVTMDPRLSRGRRLFYQAIEWALSKLTDRIVAVSSEELRHGIGCGLGLGRSRVILIPNGIEPILFPPPEEIRRELHLPDDCRAVGFIGRLVDQKAPDVLIEAFAIAAKVLPRSRLVIVGSGPLERPLRVLADRLAIADKVLWLGPCDGRRLLPAFDLFALPSRYEGLPYVTLEALSAGLPILATASAGVELPVRHRRNGLIVPPDRPDLFAAAMVELLSDPRKLEQFGRRSLELSARFTVQEMVDKTHAAYLDSLGAKDGGARPRVDRGPRSRGGGSRASAPASTDRTSHDRTGEF